MSEAVSRKIKQLENQNERFRKLLDSTLQITKEDTAKCLQLEFEANFLKKAVADLENQKIQLENELLIYLNQDSCKTEPIVDLDIQKKLTNAFNDIQKGSAEILQVKTEDDNLKALILELEAEKEKLLEDIELVKRANEESNILALEHFKLQQELNLTNNVAPPSIFSSQDLVKQLVNLEDTKQKLIKDICTAKNTPDPLGIATENTVLELKIKGIERQKENILKQLRTSLLQSAQEVCLMHSATSDNQLRGLLNELDIHKTILMLNLSDIKEMQTEAAEEDPTEVIKEELLKSLDEQISINQDNDASNIDYLKSLVAESEIPQKTSSFPRNSSEVIQEVTEIKEQEITSEESLEIKCEDKNGDQDSHDLPTVSEEDELQTCSEDLVAEHERLANEITRLEFERQDLILQIQNTKNSEAWVENNRRLLNLETRNELHGTFMQEESSEEFQKLPLDDATNQMFGTEEQMLEQRIRELEEDNERIRRDLVAMLEETRNEKDDLEVLQEGERLIRDHKEAEPNNPV